MTKQITKLNFRFSFCNFTFPLFSLYGGIRRFYCCWSFVLVSWTTHCFLTEVHRLSSTDSPVPLRRLCHAYNSCWRCLFSLLWNLWKLLSHPTVVHLFQHSAAGEEAAGNLLGTQSDSPAPKPPRQAGPAPATHSAEHQQQELKNCCCRSLTLQRLCFLLNSQRADVSGFPGPCERANEKIQRSENLALGGLDNPSASSQRST